MLISDSDPQEANCTTHLDVFLLLKIPQQSRLTPKIKHTKIIIFFSILFYYISNNTPNLGAAASTRHLNSPALTI